MRPKPGGEIKRLSLYVCQGQGWVAFQVASSNPVQDELRLLLMLVWGAESLSVNVNILRVGQSERAPYPVKSLANPTLSSSGGLLGSLSTEVQSPEGAGWRLALPGSRLGELTSKEWSRLRERRLMGAHCPQQMGGLGTRFAWFCPKERGRWGKRHMSSLKGGAYIPQIPARLL